MELSEIISTLQDSHCRNCKIGKALIALKGLDDTPMKPTKAEQSGLKPTKAAESSPLSKQERKRQANIRYREKLASQKQHPLQSEAKTGSKACNKCGQVKPFAEFVKAKACQNGVAGVCLDCKRAQDNARNAANKVQAAAPSPRKHGDQGRGPTPALNFHCDNCRAKFLTQAQLDAHNKVHHPGGTNTQKFECKECGRMFANEAALVDHVELRHPEAV